MAMNIEDKNDSGQKFQTKIAVYVQGFSIWS